MEVKLVQKVRGILDILVISLNDIFTRLASKYAN
jgi:hypothetical protein